MRRTDRWMREMRARWAERPAAIPKAMIRKRPEFWPKGWPHLPPQLAGQAPAWRTGEVRWANAFVNREKPDRLEFTAIPAEVLWSPDPFVDANPHWLATPAARFWRLKDPPFVEEDRRFQVDIPGFEALQPLLNNELRPPGRRRLPAVLSACRVVYLECILLHDQDLPGGVLSDPLLPVVIPPPGGHVRVLPLAFWPEALVEAWVAGD